MKRCLDIPRSGGAITLVPLFCLLALGACMPGAASTAPQPVPAPASASAAARTAVVTRSADSSPLAGVAMQQGAVASSEAGPTHPASSSDLSVDAYASQERVEFFVARFTGPSREYVESRLERGSRYEPMIRRMLRDAGLPEDMYYLGLVESGYDPNAYSRAAAVGMWQFMATTAKGMGLRVDWWVDERRDPVRSTSAAVRFLRGLNQEFGSMYLAAAAYNGGPGRVARGLSKYADELEGAESDDAFFVLSEKNHLHRETRDYVPQLIAAAIVARDPQRYGLTIRTREPFAYDSVFAPAELPLASAARAARTTVATLKELNPQVLRGMTPPSGRTLLRLPVGAAEGFGAALDSMPASEKRGAHRVTTRKGDTWSKVATREKVSASTLRAFNPKARVGTSGRLIPWQTLIVPTREVAAAALSVPDPTIERHGGTLAALRVHVVKRGETLGHLALRYHSTTAAIMRQNGLRKPVIRIGQRVTIPRSADSRG